MLLWAIVAAAALLWIAALALPGNATPPRPQGARAAVSNAPFFGSRWFIAFLVATMLIQGSHAAYYTFASIHWRGLGLSDQTVGLLWGASLLAEVAFFAFGRSVVDRLGAVNVILVGGVAAALRWTAIGVTGNPALLALAQLLHAFSFGASHFAAIRIISEKVDDSLSASGQGLYSAFTMGLGMGIFVLVSGPLYGAFGTGAFFVMALVALVGTATMAAALRLSMARITAAPAPLPAGMAVTLGA
jgi:PPP family 3-phenylpropionic acid transporter